MNLRIIAALVQKDIAIFFRNQFFALITVLALIGYIAIYLLMPSEVDETLEIGFYSPLDVHQIVEVLEEEDIVVIEHDSIDALQRGMRNSEYDVAIALSNRFNEQLRQDVPAEMTLYFTSDFPEEFRDGFEILFQEMGFLMAGEELFLDVEEVIIGPDMVGTQIPDRERLLPLLAVFLLMMETLGLASLITGELEHGTLQAVLITPANLASVYVGKAIFGVGLAFVQAGLLMLATGRLSNNPLLTLTALFLGALLATGVGFMVSSIAKDFMSVMAWGMLALVVLAIPATGVLLPGSVSDWSRIVPSHYLVDTVYRVSNFGASWADMSQNLLILLAYSIVLFVIGIVALQRRQQRNFA